MLWAASPLVTQPQLRQSLCTARPGSERPGDAERMATLWVPFVKGRLTPSIDEQHLAGMTSSSKQAGRELQITKVRVHLT